MKKLKRFIWRTWLKLRLNSVALKYHLLLILQYVIMLVLAFIFDRVIELLTMIPLFFIYTKKYTKQYHCKTLIKCGVFSIFIFTLSFILMPSKNQFVFSSVIFVYAITTISYFVKDYIERKIPKVIFFKGMEVEDLPKDLVGIEKDLMIQYYIKRYKLDKIAFNLGYSVDNIKKIKSKIIKRYS